MLGLLGKKLGQTSVYDAQGTIVPVTVVLVGPNRVIQTKTVESDGYNAVQLGFDDQKEQRVTKPLLGHFKKHGALPVKHVVVDLAKSSGAVPAASATAESEPEL